jgi:hypothetical protein
MVNKVIIFVIFAFISVNCLFSDTETNLPQWAKKIPNDTNELGYFVGEGRGETLLIAEENAIDDIRGKISERYCKNIRIPNTQYEMGLYIIVEIMDNSNRVVLVDKYEYFSNGIYEYKVLYSIDKYAFYELDESINNNSFLRNSVFNEGIERAVYFSAIQLLNDISINSKVALINVASDDVILGEFIFEELSGYLTSISKISVFDRKSLESLRQEKKFQMTSDVDEATAIGIGHYSGANVVITGSISGSGRTRRLRFKALDVLSGRIMAQTSNEF